MSSGSEAQAALRRYWGYESFRPLQERIVASLVGGHDTCVVMPTGGGKSLCYQLPAAMMPGKTVIVVSPLLALMQDQVAQLAQMGIPAEKLNSSLPHDEQFRIMHRAKQGEYRLLYLSPERLAREDTIPWLKQSPVSFFTIDEAHCISEWGHEFRPEYRKLSSLRAHFPDCPIAAFTASATRRVRHDIIDQLRLRNPHKYIASFHRANLRYLVRECDDAEQRALLVRALKQHKGSNVIIYSPTIRKVGETVDLLASVGISAVGYHAKMSNEQRKRNQEQWMSDDVRVLVGTIAFGLGINKPSVRSVIHLALPKSIEQYYQEAGRAGRDGLASDCILLWQKKDLGLLAYFINQIEDPAEKQRGWERYHEICRFAESHKCRHRQICLHFGETPKWNSCSACDVCSQLPEWLSAHITQPKQGRRKKKTGVQVDGKRVEKSKAVPAQNRGEVNAALRDHLRSWRRAAAAQKGIPAFTVMHDTTLDELSRVQPESLAALSGIYGFGPRKTEQYGHEIVKTIKSFRASAGDKRPQKS
jgi:ATP-dependent DNA helicase RecQ